MWWKQARNVSLAALLLVAPLASALAVGVAPAADDAPDGPDLSPVFDDPWWPEWLAHNDRDGDRVDDAAQEQARDALAAGTDLYLPLLVNYGRTAGDADAELLESLGAVVLHQFTWIPTMLAAVPAAAVDVLGHLPGVVAVEWDRPLAPLLDVSAPATQALEASGSPYNGQTAEALGYLGEGMVVAVIDTGVSQGHPAFEGKWIAGAQTTFMGSNYGPVAPRTGAIACIDPTDDGGHGTHVAGTVLGNQAGSPHRGTAPGARLVEIKIDVGGASALSGTLLLPFRAGGGDEVAFEWVMEYNQAIDDGAPLCGVSADDRIDVATMSFGSRGAGGPNAGTMEAVLTQLSTTGVVSTIAAGNVEGSEFTVASPGNAAATISVANSDDRNTIDRADDQIEYRSSRGPVQDSATGLGGLADRDRKPEIAAPGTNILAPSAYEGIFRQYGLPLATSEYVSKTGTSMATPHVAGIAVLLLQAGEEASAQTGGVNLMRPTGSGYDALGAYVLGENPVRDALAHGAEYHAGGVPAGMLSRWEGPNGAGLTWNNGYGYGHVDAFSALCWAWDRVLEPAGATPPASVSAACSPLPDRDGDGVPDVDDAFPDDPAEWADTDGDGVGDNGDRCPGHDDHQDADGDGTPDGCQSASSGITISSPADGAVIEGQGDLTVTGDYVVDGGSGDGATATTTASPALTGAAESTNDGIVPGVLGEVGDVRVSDDGTALQIEMFLGFADDAAPTLLGNPVSYEVQFTTHHNVDLTYRVDYRYEVVVTDGLFPTTAIDAQTFDLTVVSAENNGLRSYCPTSGDLSGSRTHYDPDAGTYSIQWVVPFDALVHANEPPQGGCSQLVEGGEPLQAGDTVTDIRGAAVLKLGVITFGDFQDESAGPATYTVGGDVPPPPCTDGGHVLVSLGNRTACTVLDTVAGGAWTATLAGLDLAPGDHELTATARDGETVLSTQTVTVTVPHPDRDGDGVPDKDDAFPDDSTEWQDTDGDGVGDNGDACPGHDDGRDLDGDGTPDGCDGDMDGDGRPDDRDADDDGDGHPDTKEEAFGTDPRDPSSYPQNGPSMNTAAVVE